MRPFMTQFSVNLNKFALLRNSRGANMPNVLEMARRAIAKGVHGITVHPRPDQRHTRYQDVYDLAALVRQHPGVELNIEGNPEERFLEVVLDAKPHQCTLVPDAPDQLTSDHGWNLIRDRERLSPVVRTLQEAGIRVSVFLDPNLEQLTAIPNVAPDRIELYTEAYARAFGSADESELLGRYAEAAARAEAPGVGVNAGHDLNLANLEKFLVTVPNVLEVSIGHAVVCESFDYTFEGTLERYLGIVNEVAAQRAGLASEAAP
jgi:pyridoxine 5-phosphate synthase